MSRIISSLQSFNRGVVSALGLARTDIKRIALSAETQTNWMPRVLGSMMLRPGIEHIGSTKSNAKAFFTPFVFSSTDTALIELTNLFMRVWVSDAVLTRVAVTAAITNGTFPTDLTGWTDADEAGASSTWGGAGSMFLTGTNFNAAIRYQLVTLGGGDSGKVHALAILVGLGKVLLRIGSTVNGQEFLEEQELSEGRHSIAFIPTANFYVQFSARTAYISYINSVAVEAAGAMELITTYALADLPNIRFDQSGDVIFIACRGQQQRRLERRSNGSWSFVIYDPEDGPFRADNLTPTTLTSNATTGEVTITASRGVFTASNVDSLYRIESVGQFVTASIGGADQWSDSIMVTGFGAAEREFDVVITGTWSGTVTLQRSIGVEDAWLEADTYTSNTTTSIDDDLDDQTVYYRIGIDTGDYTSGTALVSLSFNRGSITGIVRILGYTNPTSVSAQVLKPLGGITASQVWAEGAWSGRRGWPSAVALFEGRLWWAGMDRIWGSVSDGYESFDDTIEGDSAPISRSIGSGPVETLEWLLPLQRLLAGGQGAEFSMRSSSLDEPLTPTNFSIKPASTQGSAGVAAQRIDGLGVFVQRGGAKVYELSSGGSETYYDYGAVDLTQLAPDLCSVGIVSLAIQRQPDTRVHCVLSDGSVAINVFDKVEEVRCWVKFDQSTDDVVQAVVLPSTGMEDHVYYQVKIGSSYYLAKWALESECQGGQLNKQADMFVEYTGGAISSLTGMTHLNGRTVVIWADGIDRGTAVASAGAVALGGSYTNVVAGMGYTAQYKSMKLAYADGEFSSLVQRKRITQVGVIARNMHYQGLKFGPDFSTLDSLPLIHEEATTAANTIHAEFDTDMIEFPGEWSTDSRLCLQAAAPRPCTLLAAVIAIDTEQGFSEANRRKISQGAE